MGLQANSNKLSPVKLDENGKRSLLTQMIDHCCGIKKKPKKSHLRSKQSPEEISSSMLRLVLLDVWVRISEAAA